jgi:hypothetical protein
MDGVSNFHSTVWSLNVLLAVHVRPHAYAVERRFQDPLPNIESQSLNRHIAHI